MTIYIYGLFCPVAQTIRYVGKSSNPQKRLNGHVCGALRGYYDHHTARWLRALHQDGHRPEIVILHEVVPSESWQEIERAFIASAADRGWNLTNSTAGGEGLDYLDPKDDARYRANLSRSLKQVWSSPERRAEAKARSRAVADNPELLARRNEAIRAAYSNPEVRALASNINREIGSRPEVKDAKSGKMKAVWDTDEYRATITAARNDPEFTDAQAQRLRDRWSDPAAREKMNNARWTPEKRREQAERIAAYNARRKEQSNG